MSAVRRARIAMGAGAALALAGIGSAVVQPSLWSVHAATAALGCLAWVAARRAPVLSGLAATAAAFVAPWYGLITPEASTSVVWEIGWLTLGFAVASASLPSAVAGPVLLGASLIELGLILANPAIGPAALYSMGAILALLGGLGFGFARLRESMEREIDEREEALRAAEAEARARADEAVEAKERLALMQTKLVSRSRLAALGEIAGAVAHEINNPLAAIALSTDELREAHTDESELAEAIDTIDEAARRCHVVVQRLLEHAQRGDGEPRDVDLSEVATDAVELMRRHLQLAGASVEIDLRRDLWVRGDPDQLGQVLLNLLLNAGEAIDTGGQIRVEAGEKEDEVWLSVRDDGRGVPEKSRPRVFQPFVTDRPDAAGLGLALCHTIVQRHGGHIELESRPGATQFTMRLPAA